MNFKILHLSDMHISSNEDSNHKMLRNNLVNYVKGVSDIDAIIITGDIVDRYDKKAFSVGKDFVGEILDATGLEKDKVLIVPGNHDMERNYAVEKILDESELRKDGFLSKNEKYIRPRMEEYACFINFLELGYENDNRYGYGIRMIEKGGKKICFNLLNSAWSSKGNSDYKHLFIGREQLEHNRKKISEQENIECVISIMHHPLSWFHEEDEKMLKDYLINEDKLGSPVVLHGHIHDAVMQAEEYPTGKILSLISGIGYPEGDKRVAGQPKISSCRFSIYNMDLERKKVECFCLVSLEDGQFVPENRLYGGSQDGCYIMWWDKKQEFREPERKYIDLDPIPVIKCWSGRKEELELFSKGDANVIAISGVGGQGKTALAAEFMRRDAESEGFFEQRVWVDCRELQDTMHAKLLKILELLTNGEESENRYKDEQLKDTIKRFLRYIQWHKTIVVFDNIDAYVTFDSEELTGELKDIVDGVLMQQTDSLIILTCRTSIYDSNAGFRSMCLDGLKEPDGITYFIKRGISVAEQGDIDACKRMIRIIKGHPWWIGLICGQMLANRLGPKDYLEQNSDGLLMHNSQLEQYFSVIWNKLGNSKKGEIRKNIIRFLVESARPLTVGDLSNLLNENYNQTSKAIGHLYRISLLIEHDRDGGNEKSYQVHPLVREYIHKLYSSEMQKPLVLQLLQLLIGKKLYDNIFGNGKRVQKEIECNVKDIIDSIETCLNSRNESEALDLITYSFETLCNDGRLAEYLELSGRILDKIDWEKEQIAQIKRRSEFLYHYLDLLCLQDHKADKAYYYLSLYENNCEKNTIAYSGYLIANANVNWCLGNYQKAYQTMTEYDCMKENHADLWRPIDIDNLKGMILREYGSIDEALKVFGSNSDSDAKFGNIARCYMKLGRYVEAIDNLKICLKQLENKKELTDSINRGYAYFWIAEIYYQQGKYQDANVFMTICQEIWKEYAPGLLVQTGDLLEKLEEKDIEMKPNQKEEAVRKFMNG